MNISMEFFNISGFVVSVLMIVFIYSMNNQREMIKRVLQQRSSRISLIVISTCLYGAFLGVSEEILDKLVYHQSELEIGAQSPFSAIGQESKILINSLLIFMIVGIIFWGSLQKMTSSRKYIFNLFKNIHFFYFVLFYLSTKIYLLGTDSLGIDIFYLMIKSLKTGFSFVGLTLSITIFLGTVIGLIAGWARGWKSIILDIFYTIVNTIPSLLLLMIILFFVQDQLLSYENLNSKIWAEVSILSMSIAFGCTQWVHLCRLVRAETLKIRELDYITALRVMNVSLFKILFKHILPQLYPLIFLVGMMEISGYFLAEALLSFLGLGLTGQIESFGSLMNQYRTGILLDPIVWWPILDIFFILTPLVVSFNVLRDNIESIKNEAQL